MLHREIQPTVERLANIHFNFTGTRHYEVNEIISVYHLHALASSGLEYVESLRLIFCVLICPQRHELFSSREDVQGMSSDELLQRIGLVKNLEKYFSNVRHLAAGDSNSAEASAMWVAAEEELKTVSMRVEGFARLTHDHNGQRLQSDTYEQFVPLLDRVVHMVTDFLISLAEDTVVMFQPPNFVSREMLPSEARAAATGNEVDIFVDSAAGKSFRPAFAGMLRDSASALTQPAFAPHFRECASLDAAGPAARMALPTEFAEMSASVHRDITGIPVRQGLASPLQLLDAVARHVRLSNLFISVQVSPYLLTPSPSCGSRLVLYDPSHCLADKNWGGYQFHLNPLPPFNLTVVYKGKSLGPGTQMPAKDVHSIHVPSMDTQWSSLVSTYKSMNHHSPDMLFVNPFVGNCQIVDRLLDTGSVKPKIVYLPINPLVPPPSEVSPDFFDWWDRHNEVLLAQIMEGVSASADSPAGMPISTSIWLAQCSLAAGNKRMRGHGYRLVHVEHTYAVFLWKPLFLKLFGSVLAERGQDADLEPLHTAWLRGWQCSPHSRYLFDLEVLAGGAAPASAALGWAQSTPSRAELRRLAAAVVKESPTQRYFLARPLKGGGAAGAHGRGRCNEGICECLPPFRGEMCELEDMPRVQQKVKAVIHYITAETERDLVELSRSLSSLWLRYNRRFDYSVVIFHEGLSPAARHRIVAASENRVWFSLLPRFTEVPPEWAKDAEEVAKDFSVGYRAMIRWRSGPCFLEPALASFDYAMTLDTDSYFPAEVDDPFELLHQEGWVAAFPHLGRESASVVVNFMHHFLLYCRLQGLHPRRTGMLQSLIETNYKWYQQCLMLDIEILRLDWFRGETYQDFFRYMDSTGGFWLHRWGNNPVRTFAVGLLLEDSQVRSFVMPYAHQDYCSCGHGAPACRLDKTQGRFFYTCDEAAPGADPPAIGVGDLAEGLLDLQPWRGTDRQKQRFKISDVRDFVDQQFGDQQFGETPAT